ncbi:MAG: hypothetical protein EBZ48_08630 [Proteobacteria bacterium]|nr:hypothetical protein [Pseudomonadota bacterium]
MSNSLLTYLCREIDSGRPLAALLRAAEYLPPDSPVWLALTKKARAVLRSDRYAAAQGAISKVLTGTTLEMLTAEERARLSTIHEHPVRPTFVIPQIPPRRAAPQALRLRLRRPAALARV